MRDNDRPRASLMNLLAARRFFRRIAVLTVLVNAGVLAIAADRAPAGPPPDGVYTCTMTIGGMLSTLGKLELREGRYRGFSGERFAPYTSDPDGGLTLTAGLRGMPEGTSLLSVKHVGPDRRGRALIKIRYRSPRGATQVIDAIQQS
jgi:hypothetical protein